MYAAVRVSVPLHEFQDLTLLPTMVFAPDGYPSDPTIVVTVAVAVTCGTIAVAVTIVANTGVARKAAITSASV